MLVLRPIQPGDKVTGFSLGRAEFSPLKAFLRKDAKTYHQENIAKTFVLVDPDEEHPQVHGYITLICSEIDCSKNNASIESNKYSKSPAVKIARLAVRSKSRGHAYGVSIVKWAIANVIENIMPYTGCRFLVVDSKKSAIGYYENIGFTLLDTKRNRESKNPILFIDLHKLQKKDTQKV